jgi:carboxyl-terminal processing protease
MPHYQPNKKTENTGPSRWIPLVLGAMLSLGVFIGYFLRTANGSGLERIGRGSAVDEVLRFIETRYVDTTNADRLSALAIQAILRELDPHSSFIPASELQRVNEELEGNFQGVGIRFNSLRDTILVLGVVPDGPSAKAGILPGDRILRINDTLVVGAKNRDEEVVARMRGLSGTTVKLTVLRRGEPVRDVEVVRGEIPIESVEAAYMLDQQTGLIKISRFSGTTYEEFSRALENLYENRGLRHLVIDLRGNPGGYLSAATKILDELFEERKLLLYTEGRASARKDYHCTGRPHFKVDKIAVLIDENSASASEILAGAVQDHDRGVLVGRRTFGKGLVQEQYDLSDGSALRLTIARYYTPSGRCIQKPYVPGEEAYDHEIDDRYRNGELYHADSLHLSDSTEYRTDAGRTVYGGGGIQPDIFVPLDAVFRNTLYLYATEQVVPMVYDYWEQQRTRLLGRFPDLGAYLSGYQWEDAAAMDFVALQAEKFGLPKALIPEAAQAIKPRFKAELGRLLYGDDAYFRVLDQRDPMLTEALRAIGDDVYRLRAMGLE